jgi:hypothetical protein
MNSQPRVALAKSVLDDRCMENKKVMVTLVCIYYDDLISTTMIYYCLRSWMVRPLPFPSYSIACSD